MSYWKDTKNAAYKVGSSADFLADSSIPENIRDTYRAFINTVELGKVARNDKGYYNFEWTGDDPQIAKTYSVTYNDQYGFGVMRGPTRKKKEADQKTLDSNINIESLLKEGNEKQDKIIALLEALVTSLAGPKPASASEGIQEADVPDE